MLFGRSRQWKAPGSLGWQFNNIIGEYRSLGLDDIDEELQPVRKGADASIAKCPRITWSDVYVFERAVLRLQPVEVLKRRAWSMREKYRAIVGEEMYKKYLDSKPPDPERSDESDLRIDLEILLGKFHRYYSAHQQREEMISGLMRTLGTILLGTFLLIFAWLNYSSSLNWPEVPLIMMVAFSGMAGAFASILQRIQKFKASSSFEQDDTLIMLSALDYGRLGVYFALISGVVFSTALFLVFASQILKGPFFPEIFTPKDNISGGLPFSLFAAATNPVNGIEYAKLLVWSFLSGFAERMVPDVLDRIAKKATSESSGK